MSLRNSTGKAFGTINILPARIEVLTSQMSTKVWADPDDCGCGNWYNYDKRGAPKPMSKNLEDLLRERPGNPEAQTGHRARMLETLRVHQFRELRAIWRLRPARRPTRGTD